MKKYQQLLIVSLGLLSFICFLIYKHEYDRLRNVLEVLEVFGTPPSPPQASSGLVAHPLELGHNPNLGVGSINELKLGQGGLVEVPKDQTKDKVNQIQNSGEVIDNVIDEGGGGGDDKIIGPQFGAFRKQRSHHPQSASIFKETQYQKEPGNNEAF